MTQNFFGDVFKEFGKLGSRAWEFLLLFGGIMTVADVVIWAGRPGLQSLDMVIAAITFSIGLGASYYASMSMIQHVATFRGMLGFLAGTAFLFAPLMAAIAMILLSTPSADLTVYAALSLSLLVVGWLAIVYLPAWPVAQALSPGFVSPVILFRETKGHRWSLVLASFLGGAFNKIVPSTDTATSLVQAGMYAALGSLASIFSIVVFVALGVTAWRYGEANSHKTSFSNLRDGD